LNRPGYGVSPIAATAVRSWGQEGVIIANRFFRTEDGATLRTLGGPVEESGAPRADQRAFH